MLNIFKKNEPQELPFTPEIALYQIKDEAENKQLIHIRFASGDENQINKNFRVSADSIKSIELTITEFEKFQCLPSHPSIKFIDFKSIIKIERFESPPEEVVLAEHRVAIHGQYKRITKSDGKKSRELTWMTLDEAEREIKEILQDEFSAALDDFLNIGNEPQVAVRPIKGKNPKNIFNFNNILNFALIAVITYTVIVFAYGKFKTPTPTNFQTQNTALETVTPEEISKQISDQSNKQSAEDLALQEFGLEAGVNLNQ